MSSPRRVAIVDVGLGNLRSVVRAIERAGGVASLVADPNALRDTDCVVVPGQGAFGDFARALAGGMGEALLEALERGTPYLGICLGMQILFERSEEAPGEHGLGVFRGSVKRFADPLLDAASGERLKVPHMGWNRVRGHHALLPAEAYFYFVHSYHCVPEDESLTVGVAHHGSEICAAVAEDHVFACQFHPEKSDKEGLALLSRFLAA